MLPEKVQDLLGRANNMPILLRHSWLCGNFKKEAADLIEELVAALKEQTKFLNQSNSDWASDDTEIKELCRPFGIDVDGDSYGVPTMVDCVEQLVEKVRDHLKLIEAIAHTPSGPTGINNSFLERLTECGDIAHKILNP